MIFTNLLIGPKLNLNNLFNQSKFDQYAAFLKSTNLSTASIERKLSSLTSFQKFLIKKKLIDDVRADRCVCPSSGKQPKQNLFSKIFQKINFIPNNQSSFLFKYLPVFLLFVIGAGLGFTLYRQAFLQSQKDLAYSTAAAPISGGRFLSFQGRLTDSTGSPITSSTGIIFKLYNVGATGTGTTLYSSQTGNSQTVTPDDSGIFSVTIGKSHGTTIPSSIFSENAEVWLEITAGGEVMNPRQPIATVAYALNAETLQGMPPSASGIKNTVLVIDGTGNLNLGETSPTIKSISGTMGIEGQALLIKASDGSGGNIEINPDANGIIKLTTEGAGSTAVGGFVNLTNANLSTGNLINTSINNTNRGYNFINFSNYSIGTSVVSRFSVDAYGNTFVGATLSTTNLVVGSSSLVSNLNSDLLDGFHASSFVGVGITGSFLYTAGNGLNLSGGNQFKLGGPLTEATRLNIGSTEVMYLSTSGNVGIGTTSPTNKLDVVGDLGIKSGSILKLYLPNNTGWASINLDAAGLVNANYDWKFSGTGNHTIAGNVGIGTTNPTAKLDVNGGINVAASNWINFGNSGVGGSAAGFNWNLTNDTASMYVSEVSGDQTDYVFKMSDNATADRFVWWIDEWQGPAADVYPMILAGDYGNFYSGRLYINNNTGNVGIGTTNPTRKLEVIGDAYFSTNLTVGGTFVSVGSTNLVTNLNADVLDGQHANYFVNIGQTGNFITTLSVGGSGLTITGSGVGRTITNTGLVDITNTTLTRSGSAGSYTVGLNLGSANTWTGTQTFGNITVGGTFVSVGSTNLVTNLNANYLNGYSYNNLPYDNYNNWKLTSNGIGSTNILTGNTVNFVNGIGISLSQTGSTITINNNGVGTTYAAGSGLTLASGIFKLGGPLTENMRLNIGNTEALFIQNSTGNVGLGTIAPAYKLDINGTARISNGLLNSDDYFEKVLIGPNFTNGVANLAADIRFGNLGITGSIEVEITSTYANQNSMGKITKIFGVGTNPNNNIYTNESRVSEVIGPIQNNVSIGEFAWDATNSTYVIPISHIVSNGNPYTIKVKMFTIGGGAKSVFDIITVSNMYTLAALPKNYVHYNGNVGIGTTNPTHKLEVIGDAYFSTNLTVGGTFVSVGSTNLVTNLNADVLDGQHANYFVNIGQTGNFITTLNNGVGISITGTGVSRTIAVDYDSTLDLNGNKIGLNLGNTNIWTALQTFTNGIGVSGNSTFTNNLTIGGTLQSGSLNLVNTAVGGSSIAAFLSGNSGLLGYISTVGWDKSAADDYTSWNLQSNGAGTTAVLNGNTVNFVNGVGISLSQTGSAITINSTSVGTTYAAGSGLTLASGIFKLGGPLTENMRLNIGNTEALFIQNSTGNVGIGTASPDAKLKIAGNRSNIIDNTTDILAIGGADVYTRFGTLMGSPNWGSWMQVSNDVGTGLALSINPLGGNVGIGTSDPGAKLAIFGSTGESNGIQLIADGWAYKNRVGQNGIGGNQFVISQNYSLANGTVDSASFSSNAIVMDNLAGGMKFYTGGYNAVPSPRITIDYLGSVGIGTTNPYSKLSVVSGSGLSTGLGIYTSDFALGTTGSVLGFKFGAATGNTFSEIQSYTTGANAYGNLSLNASGGNVGIGTTNPAAKLHITTSGEGIRIDRTGGTPSIKSGSADGYMMIDSAGQKVGLNWYVADDVILVNGGGKVGIGNNAPKYKLEVTGDALISTKLGVGATSATYAFNVSTNGNIGTNLTVGSSLTIGSIPTLTDNNLVLTSNSGIVSSINTSAWDKSSADDYQNWVLQTNSGTGSSLSTIGTGSTVNFIAGTNITIGKSGNSITINNSAAAYTASNGLSLVGQDFRLGGLLSMNTDIGFSGFSLTFSDAGSTFASFSSAGNTFYNPTTFTSSGDVSMAYDLNFTNSSGSNINTAGPLTINAGENFNSSNLTLQTYNAGKIILNSSNLWTDGTNFGIGTTNPLQTLSVNGAAGLLGAVGLGGYANSNFGGAYINYSYASTPSLYVNQGSSGASAVFMGGNVGIGTTNPGFALDLQSANDTSGWITQFKHTDTSTGIHLGGRTNVGIIGTIGGGNMSLNPDGGNVGIGTTAPIGKLTVKETLTSLEINTNANSSQILSYDRTNSLYKQLEFRGSFFTFNPNDVEKVRIDNAGNVGIGTTNPGTKLEVVKATQNLTQNIAGNSQVNLGLMADDAVAADIGGAVGFGGQYITGNSTNILYAAIAGRKVNGTSGNAEGYLSFNVWNNTGLNEKMRIMNTGNVGIGTTNPLSKLSINGGLHVGGDSDAGDNNILADGTITGANVISTGNNGFHSDVYAVNVANPIWSFGNANTYGLSYYQGSALPGSDAIGFHFGTVASPIFTFDGNGYLGIGTTNPTSNLHVIGNGNFTTSLNVGTTLQTGSLNLVNTAVGGSSIAAFLSGNSGLLGYISTVGWDKSAADDYTSWNLQSNGAGTTAVLNGNTVNFVNGVGISLSQTGSTITINNIGGAYTASTGITLVGNDIRLNLGYTPIWTGLHTFAAGIGVTGNAIFTNNLTIGGTFVSVGSQNLVTNLNADLLDGVNSTYFTRRASTENSMISSDTRNNNYDPDDRDAGLYADFKANATDGLSDGGGYHGVLTFRKYGATTDMSGGYPMQIAYTDNGNLWTRMGIGATNWGTWYKSWNSNNDGTTSGLDADLLDGNDSTYFLNIGQTGALPYVNDATNTTLTRSGAGPYTLGLNLSNANTWTATQTFNATNALNVGGTAYFSSYVGIGTATPAAALDIVGGINLTDQMYTLRDSVRTFENVASYYPGSTPTTGTIIVTIANTPNVMLEAEIIAQAYNGLTKCQVRGYTYTSQPGWHLPAATCLGSGSNGNYTVRFGKRTSDGARVILIGTTSSNWGNYPHVAVTRVTYGYPGSGSSIGNWSISMVTDESAYSNIVDVNENTGFEAYTPIFGGLSTLTGGFDSNAASTITSLTLDGNSGTALNISGASFTTDINLQNSETIDNDIDGTIRLTATNTNLTGNLQIGGTTVIDSNKIHLATNGTVGAPSYTFISDTDTGLYSGGANILKLTTAGTDRLTILASGNVGIGTTSPRSKLEVVSGTPNTDGDLSGTAGSFNSATPGGQSSTLSIESNDTVAANTGGVLGFGGRYSGTAYANWASIKGLKADATSGNYGGYMSFYTRQNGAGSVERMRISDTGLVGIGTTNPSEKLDVVGNVKASGNFIGNKFMDIGNTVYALIPANTDPSKSSLSLAATGSIRFNYNDNTGNHILTAAASRIQNFTNGLLLGVSSSTTGAVTGWNDQLFLKTGGFVGIGTTNPAINLEVRSDGTGTWQGRMGLSNATSDKQVFFGNYGSIAGVFAHNFALNAWADLYINTVDGLTGMVIKGAGNVGIGTTNPADKLEVNGNISLAGGAKEIHFRNSGGTISQYVWLDSNLSLGIGAGSGPTSMFIETSGNVGIGTADPGTKLQIENQASFNGTTPGLGLYGLHFSGQTTADYANGITWNGGTGTNNAQAGIYVQGSGAYGTKMYFATTDAYASGSKTRMMIDYTGNVGIGTGAAAPTQKLEVAGNALLNLASSKLYIQNTTKYVGAGRNNDMSFINDSATWTRISGASGLQFWGNGLGDSADAPQMQLTTAGQLDVTSAAGAGGYISSGSYGGTGNAAWFPSGLYSAGTNWIYGTTVFNGAASGMTSLDVAGDMIVGAANSTSIRMRDNDESTNGPKYIHANSNNIGFLNGGGSWITRWDNSGNQINTGNITLGGDILATANYGLGLVGVYSDVRYQNVFAMGTSWRLAADGTTPGNLYGLAWTHSNIGGQSKAGLSHQLLLMENGITKVALGSGIWTSGSLSFPNTGVGLNWGAGYSTMFDSGDLHITTDDNMNFDIAGANQMYLTNRAYTKWGVVIGYPDGTNFHTNIEASPIYTFSAGAGNNNIYLYWRRSSDGHAMTWNVAGAAMDIAEWFTAGNQNLVDGKSNLFKGEVVCSDENDSLKVVSCNQSNSKKLIGVVSTFPNQIMGSSDMDDSLDNKSAIALNGQVPVIAITKNGGQISIGDVLTSSEVSGASQKLTQAGYSVAKSIENSNWNDQNCPAVSSLEDIHWPGDKREQSTVEDKGFGDGKNDLKSCYKLPDGSYIGKVMALINLSYYDPDINLTATGEVNINYNISPEVLASLGYDGTKNEIESTTYSLTDSLGNTVTRISQFAEIASAKIKTGFLSATNIVTKNLVAEKINTKELVSPKGNFDEIIATDIQTTSIVTDTLIAKEATVSTLYADNIISKEGSFGELMTEKVSSLRDELKKLISTNTASSSAITGTSLMSQTSGWSMDIASDSATINGDLALTNNLIIGAKLLVNGDTQLGNAFVSGTFTAGEIAIKDNFIETTNSALYIQPSSTGSVHIMGETLVIAENGNVQINGNLTVSGSLMANLITADEIQTNKLTSKELISDEIKISTDSAQTIIAESGFASIATSSAQLTSNATAGTATLPAGKTEIIINNNKITANSMVYLTPVGSTQNQVPYIKSKVVSESGSSFTIALDQPLTTDVIINWWIIN